LFALGCRSWRGDMRLMRNPWWRLCYFFSRFFQDRLEKRFV
jgi:hypothetical protein